MAKEKYTFEDWKNGKIDKDFEEGRISEVVSKGLGRLVEKVHREGLIPKDEYRKIQKAQGRAFFIAVEKTVNKLTNLFKAKLDYAFEPKKLLDMQIKELNERIDNASRSHLKDVYSNRWQADGIDSDKYNEIMNVKNDSSIIHISNPSSIPDEEERERATIFYLQGFVTAIKPFFDEETLEELPEEAQPFNISEQVYNQIYDLTVKYRFLKRLEELREKGIDGTKKITSNTTKDLSDPVVVAKEFMKQAKNTNTPYSMKEYVFVMEYARDHQNENSISALIRDIKSHPKCPEKIKPKNKAKNSIRNWINFYDKYAGIERN
jgi:transposase